MEKFQINDKVTWIEELAIVPHPEGKLGSDGNVLPVFSEITPVAYALGASASVMAVLIAAATYVPNFTVQLIFFLFQRKRQ
jgi:hypothetical protein